MRFNDVPKSIKHYVLKSMIFFYFLKSMNFVDFLKSMKYDFLKKEIYKLGRFMKTEIYKLD